MNNFPDKDLVMDEVHSLATEARDHGTTPREALDTAARAPGVMAPIYMGKAHEVVPDHYVLHYSISICANCGAESRESTFYALNYLRSRVNGTRVRHLVRCDRPWYNLPVKVLPTGQSRVPFCCECPTIDLSHLPPPPEPSQLHDLAEPTRKGAKPKAAKEAAKPTSLDDLI